MNRLTEKQINDIIRYQEAKIGKLEMKIAYGYGDYAYMKNDIRRRKETIAKYERMRTDVE